MERYLINYLKENSEDQIVCKYIDFFKVEFDWFIYAYGEHLNSQYKRHRNISFKTYIQYLISLFNTIKSQPDLKNVLSNVSFADKSQIKKLGLNLTSSVFLPKGKNQIIGDWQSIVLQRKIQKRIYKKEFTDLFNKDFFYDLENFQPKIIKNFEKYNLRALFLFTDQYFASKYLIDIFQKINRPSLIFSHGLPGIYSKDVDNRSDYLMVWGEQIRNNYINVGFAPEKIKVIGNPKYNNFNSKKDLRNSLENILVIPISSIQWHQHRWSEPRLIDRSMAILYLYQVQHVLSQLGVKRVRFRPHPSMNKQWYSNFLDQNFFEIDNDILSDSIKKSTLLIGSVSTTLLESLMYGVNYLVYEPCDENSMNLCKSKNVPPFDGSLEDFSIARTEEDLIHMIKTKYQTPIKILEGYMQPLDLSILKDIVK